MFHYEQKLKSLTLNKNIEEKRVRGLERVSLGEFENRRACGSIIEDGGTHPWSPPTWLYREPLELPMTDL